MRALKARLVSLESPAEAVAYWDEYLDWNFWQPLNHMVMVELAVSAGDFTRASDALKWLKGTSHGPWAEALIRRAWAAERAAPPDVEALVRERE